ncbi:MAG: arylsulfatase, partial [Parapedobacter sp.]
PFIVQWKGRINTGVSDAVICQMDLLASLADLTAQDIESSDSRNLLQVLLGDTNQGRNELILEASSRTALRKGDWVMIPPYNGPTRNEQVNIELGNSDEYQLYNIKDDAGQQTNLTEAEPEKLKEMIDSYEAIRGHSDKPEPLKLE